MPYFRRCSFFYKIARFNPLQKILHRINHYLRFYAAADTRYQVHSPFVFEWVNAVLEDRRWYYAFEDIEAVRREMQASPITLEVEDHGSAASAETPVLRQIPVRNLARKATSSPCQGRMLFRTAQWLHPARMLELGSSVGIGAMYLASAARHARLISLEGSDTVAHVARTNLGILDLHHQAEVVSGPFQRTLGPALEALGQVDLIFFDGHHREAATLDYFERCLPYCHAGSVLVFDDMYWSAEMTAAWEKIKQHQRVTLSIDCYDLGLVFLNPELGPKKHYRLVPLQWKPWKVF